MVSRKDIRFLNRDTIKYIAIFTMLMNHIAVVFMEPRTWIYEIFVGIGYFAAVTMCFFLVEGYQYTHSRKRYALRLFSFACISEVPFCLAFTKAGVIEFQRFNMMFTLLLCFLLIWILDVQQNEIVKAAAIIGIVFVSSWCDWGILAPVFTLLFINAGNSEEKLKRAFLISAGMVGVFDFLDGVGKLTIGMNAVYAVVNVTGILLSGISIIYLYNGKRMQRGRTFSKWFFYIFYPAHLFVLGMLRIIAGA